MNEMILQDLISELDTAVGMLLVTAMSGNSEVKAAMEKVSHVSVTLGELAEEA